MLIASGLAALPMGLWLGTTSPAGAAFTGADGDIAFVSTRVSGATFGGIYQVDAQASGLGTASGDQGATSGLTDGAGGDGIDAEPFYSPNGATVFFSSNRSSAGAWAIYSIAAGSPEPPGSASELSAQPGLESADDYAPSVAADGRTVVFNRDDAALFTLDAGAPTPSSTVCQLYAPAGGLAAVGTDGATSRALFDPTDPTELLYVGADNHLHLVRGLPAPSASTPSNPCGAVDGVGGVTDTDLSATAVDSLTETTDATGSYQDENPDWSPNGAEIVFDSTRGGSNHTIWTLTNLNSGTLTATPLWPGQVGAAGGTHKSATEPVFSPDGTEVAFVQPGPGTNVWDGEIVGMGNPIANEQDVSLSTQGTGTENYQPDWQPLSNPNGGETPEVPLALMLPGSALLIGGLAVAQRRRSTLRATRRRTA